MFYQPTGEDDHDDIYEGGGVEESSLAEPGSREEKDLGRGNVYTFLRELRKEERNVARRLHSIRRDARFLSSLRRWNLPPPAAMVCWVERWLA